MNINELVAEKTIQSIEHISAQFYEQAFKTSNLATRYRQFRLANAYANVAKSLIKLQEIRNKELQNE